MIIWMTNAAQIRLTLCERNTWSIPGLWRVDIHREQSQMGEDILTLTIAMLLGCTAERANHASLDSTFSGKG